MHGSSHGSERLIAFDLASICTLGISRKTSFEPHRLLGTTRHGFTAHVTHLVTLPLRNLLAETLGPRFGASLQNHASDRAAPAGGGAATA